MAKLRKLRDAARKECSSGKTAISRKIYEPISIESDKQKLCDILQSAHPIRTPRAAIAPINIRRKSHPISEAREVSITCAVPSLFTMLYWGTFQTADTMGAGGRIVFAHRMSLGDYIINVEIDRPIRTPHPPLATSAVKPIHYTNPPARL